MSTRPYATHGGLRIRQCFNRAVIRCRERYKRLEPTGASEREWDAWCEWILDREDMLMSNRDLLVKQAEQHERRKRNERKRDHGKCAPRGH